MGTGGAIPCRGAWDILGGQLCLGSARCHLPVSDPLRVGICVFLIHRNLPNYNSTWHRTKVSITIS